MDHTDTIGIGADHAGFSLKEILKTHLQKRGFAVKDYGTFSDQSVDYPDYAHPLAADINSKAIGKAIVLCGSGNGVNMTVNKYPGVRSALCWSEQIAILARRHNDANICALPARFITEPEAQLIVDTFLDTPFDGGRHQRRVEKIKSGGPGSCYS